MNFNLKSLLADENIPIYIVFVSSFLILSAIIGKIILNNKKHTQKLQLQIKKLTRSILNEPIKCNKRSIAKPIENSFAQHANSYLERKMYPFNNQCSTCRMRLLTPNNSDTGFVCMPCKRINYTLRNRNFYVNPNRTPFYFRNRSRSNPETRPTSMPPPPPRYQDVHNPLYG
jgi:hypothetical protein